MPGSQDGHSFLHRIPVGWLATTGSVAGPNYDEFIDDEAVAAALAQRPDSVVALDLPQHTQAARRAGLGFLESLPTASRHLQQLKDRELYRSFTEGLFAYEMREADGHVVRALTGLVRTSEFSARAGEPGRIIRNEDVFAAQVEERRRHIEALGHLISPVLLVPGQAQQSYDELLATVFGSLSGEPEAADTDERGVTHSVWPVTSLDQRIGQVLDDNVFLVADGNHRSLAAQLSGSPWCLVVVASATGLRIEPYNRLLRLRNTDRSALPGLIAGAGVKLDRVPAPGSGQLQPADHSNYLYLGDSEWYRMGLASGDRSDVTAALPHTAVERYVFGQALGLAPSADEIAYVGGREGMAYLLSEVDAGRATAALVLRAVTIDEFTAINTARQKMPRKSTWFMPKARAGLVIARTDEAPVAVRTPG
jgi:uncharacterized protein (DUF1015 family)